MDYDAKRDRWIGYDPSSYTTEVIKEFEILEEEKKKQRGILFDTNNDVEIDEELKKKDFENDAPVNSKDPRIKTSTKNLRIREDTAKYLINRNIGSAFYDPKSRSMRMDPTIDIST